MLTRLPTTLFVPDFAVAVALPVVAAADRHSADHGDPGPRLIERRASFACGKSPPTWVVVKVFTRPRLARVKDGASRIMSAAITGFNLYPGAVEDLFSTAGMRRNAGPTGFSKRSIRGPRCFRSRFRHPPPDTAQDFTIVTAGAWKTKVEWGSVCRRRGCRINGLQTQVQPIHTE